MVHPSLAGAVSQQLRNLFKTNERPLLLDDQIQITDLLPDNNKPTENLFLD